MKYRVVKKEKNFVNVLSNNYISQHKLAIFSFIILLLSLLPLYIIALYNYPADDDFQFVYQRAEVWVSTGSLTAVFKSLVQFFGYIYMNWNGYLSAFLISFYSPFIFGIQYYFLSNWFVLTVICLSVGYMLKSLTSYVLKAPKSVFFIIFPAIVLLGLEYTPAISEAVYWIPGASYVFTQCFVWLSLGLLMKCSTQCRQSKQILRSVLLAFCGIMLGFSHYSVAISSFVLFSFVTVYSIVRKLPNRRFTILHLAFLLASLITSLLAPGNAVRQADMGGTSGILYTLITSVLDSCELVGQWFSLQIVAVLMIVLPLLWKPMKDSPYRFRYPVLIAIMLFGVFASTLTPGIYTNFGYTADRYINPVFFNFLLFVFGSIIYAQGTLIRLLERKQENEPAKGVLMATQTIGQRFSYLYLLLCLVVLLFGSFGNTIMNTASISATKSLVTGEAAQFRQEMAERQEHIRITNSDDLEVKRLTAKPYVFKADKLPFQVQESTFGTPRYMKWYFELYYKP